MCHIQSMRTKSVKVRTTRLGFVITNKYKKKRMFLYSAVNTCSIHLCIPQHQEFLISQTNLFQPSKHVERLAREMCMKLVSYWGVFENEIGETLRNFCENEIEKSWPPPPGSLRCKLIPRSLYKVRISCQITLLQWWPVHWSVHQTAHFDRIISSLLWSAG